MYHDPQLEEKTSRIYPLLILGTGKWGDSSAVRHPWSELAGYTPIWPKVVYLKGNYQKGKLITGFTDLLTLEFSY